MSELGEPCESCANNDCHKSADMAVRKVFAILGVDIDKPESVAEFQDDLRFGRRLRRASDKGFIAIVVLAATGLALAAWTGVTTKFGGHS